MESDGIPDFREDASMRAGFPLRDFAESRLREILMLSEAINEPPAKGRLFQRLPKHMRRRQMSHHQSRLPSKLRSAHGNQVNANFLGLGGGNFMFYSCNLPIDLVLYNIPDQWGDS